MRGEIVMPTQTTHTANLSLNINPELAARALRCLQFEESDRSLAGWLVDCITQCIEAGEEDMILDPENNPLLSRTEIEAEARREGWTAVDTEAEDSAGEEWKTA